MKGWPWEQLQGREREVWRQPEGEVIPFVTRLKEEGKGRVYDLGCGLGRHTVHLAREGFDVSASDISTVAVDETRRWLESEGLSAQVTASDLTAIPYPDASFDGILAMNVVYHAGKEGLEACLGEIYRALRPGGLFFVTFNSTRSDDWGRGTRVDHFTYVKVGGVEDGIPHYFVDRPELDRLISAFDVLRLSHKEEWDAESGDEKRAAHWIAWLRRPLA
jgi:tellurite methyltransferase